jgi:hypothetical protein
MAAGFAAARISRRGHHQRVVARGSRVARAGAYHIEDVGGIELLAQACAAADRAEALATIIAEDGETIKGKNGLRAHPCLKDELAARSFVVRTLARLGITTEAIKPMGRPASGYGVTHAD